MRFALEQAGRSQQTLLRPLRDALSAE